MVSGNRHFKHLNVDVLHLFVICGLTQEKLKKTYCIPCH